MSKVIQYEDKYGDPVYTVEGHRVVYPFLSNPAPGDRLEKLVQGCYSGGLSLNAYAAEDGPLIFVQEFDV